MQRTIEDWENAGKVANIAIEFYASKHGLDAMAFNIRTLFEWRAKLNYTNRVIDFF